MSNYYELLNIPMNSSQEEIKQAFRRLSFKLHPDKDKSGATNKKYTDILNAFNSLKDENIRKKYDASLLQLQTVANNDLQVHYKENVNTSSFKKNITLTTNIKITLEQAYNGCQYPVEIERFIYEDGYKIKEKEKIYINIEPGIDNGEIICIKNKGHENIDGSIGDIKVYIEVENH